MTRKQTKDIKFMVEEANHFLKSDYAQKHSEEANFLRAFISQVLMHKNMYHGYNYFIEDNGFLKLAGKETNLVQFYIV